MRGDITVAVLNSQTGALFDDETVRSAGYSRTFSSYLRGTEKKTAYRYLFGGLEIETLRIIEGFLVREN